MRFPGRRRGGDRELRSRVRAELRELGVGAPLDLDELCRRYGQRRGRPLMAPDRPAARGAGRHR